MMQRDEIGFTTFKAVTGKGLLTAYARKQSVQSALRPARKRDSPPPLEPTDLDGKAPAGGRRAQFDHDAVLGPTVQGLVRTRPRL